MSSRNLKKDKPAPMPTNRKGGKKCPSFCTFLVLALALCLAVGVQAQTDTTKHIKGWGFTSVQYTHAVTGDNGALASFGFLTHVTGPLYTAARVDVGHYGVVNNDWLLLTKVQESDFYVGMLGGLDGTFKPDSSSTLMSYINGAGGIMASYQSRWKFLGFSNLNLSAVVRYHFALRETVTYVDGWTAGFVVALPWY